MLLEIAIADAYGRGFEFNSHDFVKRHNNLDNYVCSGCGEMYDVGEYTDDTQMSIAITEMLLGGTLLTSKESYANAFVGTFQDDPRRGYSRGFYNLLCNVRTGQELLDKIKPESDRCGAAMRAMPLGVLSDADFVEECANVQASVTHDTTNGQLSARISALMTHYCYHNVGSSDNLLDWLVKRGVVGLDIPWNGFVDMSGMSVVSAALTAVIESRSLAEAIMRAVSFTGDTDSVAAITAGAISHASWCGQDGQGDIEYLEGHLENGSYGRSYLKAMDRKLLHMYPPLSHS